MVNINVPAKASEKKKAKAGSRSWNGYLFRIFCFESRMRQFLLVYRFGIHSRKWYFLFTFVSVPFFWLAMCPERPVPSESKTPLFYVIFPYDRYLPYQNENSRNWKSNSYPYRIDNAYTAKFPARNPHVNIPLLGWIASGKIRIIAPPAILKFGSGARFDRAARKYVA